MVMFWSGCGNCNLFGELAANYLVERCEGVIDLGPVLLETFVLYWSGIQIHIQVSVIIVRSMYSYANIHDLLYLYEK